MSREFFSQPLKLIRAMNVRNAFSMECFEWSMRVVCLLAAYWFGSCFIDGMRITHISAQQPKSKETLASLLVNMEKSASPLKGIAIKYKNKNQATIFSLLRTFYSNWKKNFYPWYLATKFDIRLTLARLTWVIQLTKVRLLLALTRQTHSIVNDPWYRD